MCMVFVVLFEIDLGGWMLYFIVLIYLVLVMLM